MPETSLKPGALIALTGATGFIGRHLLHDLAQRGYRCRVLLRRPIDMDLECSSAVIGDLTRPLNLSAALAGADAVVHSAGVSPGVSGLPDADHRTLSSEATRVLALAAQRARVQKFVFLSSIRAQTGPTAPGVLKEDHPPVPTDAYGKAKLEAEAILADLDLEWVALRPVSVYGKGMKGNLAQLAKLARSPWPLPFSDLNARRSLLSVGNLAAAVAAVLAHPGPLRRPLIAADLEALSVAEMIAAMRDALGRRPGMVPFPSSLLRRAMEMAGHSDAFERLACPLVVDPSALSTFGWSPQISTRLGLRNLMND